MQDIGTFSLTELIAKLNEQLLREQAEGNSGNRLPVITRDSHGYHKIEAVEYDKEFDLFILHVGSPIFYAERIKVHKKDALNE